MKIILVHPRGFCAGVRMAIDVVDQVLELFPGETVYVFHEIVHNKHVVGRFTRRGVVFVESLEDIPGPRGKIVVFSAHGISPAIRSRAQELGLFAIDATCPLVTKVHSEAVRYARQGYQILLVGHRNHQEVMGTTGEAPSAIQVVEGPEDIPRLRITDPERLVYLTQTTLSTDDAAIVIDAIKAAFPKVKEPPSSDICYATTNRQHAVRKVAPDCDLVLVVGSRNSSNSVRLTEIAANVGTRAHLLDDVGELDPAWFASGAETVMVTAGASAPEDLVADICRELVKRYGASIEQRELVEEDVEFHLPGALRKVMVDRGMAPQPARIAMPVVTPERYGAAPLTIEGRPA
ncbi:MAG: 4-hydroxy-3-methylbut-2-enyl diphosphate reductase [Phycisphaerales bacterium]|nr:4-hydroxy-3-methylbut-2-enyl diphosphate reductase [Phycisphaerales bacterium]